MHTLLRNKRKLYVCTKTETTNGVKKYSEPIELYENYRITNSTSDLTTFGLEAYQMMRIRTDKEHAQYYHIGDRVYINVTPPVVYDDMCKDADYEVYKDPVLTLNQLEVILKRRSGK